MWTFDSTVCDCVTLTCWKPHARAETRLLWKQTTRGSCWASLGALPRDALLSSGHLICAIMDTVSCDSPLSNAFVHTSEAVAASVSVPPIVRSSTLSASYVITPSTFSTTPIVCTASESSMRFSKYSSSHDFAEQIRQLEIEGNKLRSTTLSALSQLGKVQDWTCFWFCAKQFCIRI